MRFFVIGTFLALVSASSAGSHKHVVPTFSHRLNHKQEVVNMLEGDFFIPSKFPIHSSLSQPNGVEVEVSKSSVVDGEDVVVAWKNAVNPTEQDMIMMYCPVNTTLEDYLDFHFVNVSSSWREGSGSFKIKLFNMREAYRFAYVRFRDDKFHVLAWSNFVNVLEGEPLHAHLSLTEFVTQMRIMWTDSELVGHVAYSESPSFPPENTRKVVAYGKKYFNTEMCDAPANQKRAIYFRDTGYIHSAVMDGLRPDTRYYYMYSNKFCNKTGTFRSAPLPSLDRTVKFVAFGDMGVLFSPFYWANPGASATAARLVEEVKEGLELVVHFGDISYAVGHGYIWEQYGWLMSSYASFIPVMVGVGNHEYDHRRPAPGGVDVSGVVGPGFRPSWGNQGSDSHGECGVPTSNRFHMPQTGNGVFWYSFDRSLIHFVMISTEHDCSPGSKQHMWLEKDLASVDRSKFPWVILMTHRPMYANETTEHNDNVVAIHEREEFEDVLMKYKVNLMFSAHYHSYMRTCPISNFECQKPGTAPVHIVVGTAGAGLEKPSSFPDKWIVAHGIKFGYSRGIANRTHLHVDWMSSETRGQVMDSVDIPLWE